MLLAAATLLVSGCSTDEIDTFDSHSYLSFEKSRLSYTFAFADDDVKSADFEIPVTYAGRFGKTDRQFSIVAVPEKSTAREGTDYLILDASEQTIKAAEKSGTAKVRLLRSATLKEQDQTLVLAIAPNASFQPGVVDTLTITISDRIVKPDYWDWNYESYFLGTFTTTKLLLWLEFMGVKDGTNPIGTEEYCHYEWYTGYTEPSIVYYDYAVRPKIAEFRRWLINTKGNPTDETLGVPVADTLGKF